MPRELTNLSWIEELLPSGHIRKPMFGGFAFYFASRLVLVMFENADDRRNYKNKAKNKAELWNGCLFPAEREYHPEILKQYPFLMNHPILPKWLYLPLDTEDFEEHAKVLLKEIRRQNHKFGVIPKPKKLKKQKSKKPGLVDPRRPRMFSD